MSPARLSLPKDKIKILLLEGIADSAVERLAEAGYTNLRREAKALDGAALIKALKGVHILGIRSRTQVTTEVLEAAADFEPDLGMADVDANTRALAEVCLVLFNSNEFVTID